MVEYEKPKERVKIDYFIILLLAFNWHILWL